MGTIAEKVNRLEGWVYQLANRLRSLATIHYSVILHGPFVYGVSNSGVRTWSCRPFSAVYGK
jgi:hypothetical protein